MAYEVIFPTQQITAAGEASFDELEPALEHAAAMMEEYPFLLVGYRDLAQVKDASRDDAIVMAIVRVEDEFLLVRDTDDEYYTLQLLAIEHERITNPAEYTVYGRWSALDA